MRSEPYVPFMHRPVIAACLVAASLVAAATDAAATDVDGDGIDDVEQQGRDCGVDGTPPVCDDLIRALINNDESAWMRVANVGTTRVHVTGPHRRETFSGAANFRRAVVTRGGVRRFLDPAGGPGTRLVIETICQDCRPQRIVFRLTLGAATARLRFESDAMHPYHLVSITMP